jgi:hypothetical protein
MAKVKVIKNASIKNKDGKYSDFKKGEQLDLDDSVSSKLISGGYAIEINEIVLPKPKIVEKPVDNPVDNPEVTPEKPDKKGKNQSFKELMENK